MRRRHAPPAAGPGYLVRATLFLFRAGLSFWTALLGPRLARRVVYGGMALSALAAIVLQLKGV